MGIIIIINEIDYVSCLMMMMIALRTDNDDSDHDLYIIGAVCMYVCTVSYTHLTLPTNREV